MSYSGLVLVSLVSGIDMVIMLIHCSQPMLPRVHQGHTQLIMLRLSVLSSTD